MTRIARVERRSGRPRSEDADRAIIEATLELLAESGIAGTTIEGVAARAGVGKTTIYRRWKGLEDLICDAVAELKGPPPTLPGTSIRDDLLTLAEAAARGRESARNRKVYACFIGEMARYPALDAQYRESVIRPRRAVTMAALQRGIDRGELRDDLDLDVLAEIVTAPTLHWMLHNPDRSPSREQLEQFLDGVLNGVARR
ncbi:TetR/AcrR family transcriptional regulator [Jiangella alkaliphila]|uniref:DNA-binding transcriptional regulator, AcrR family n=1 Tax=Jiangella alkaliphila TaxID=419479 RepID=A0A1H2KNM7_9ACTN|nr:TetR/AcrR family transcriptional regulator [Jiangella alkaliphila]SDU70289.1 DNA-binding transcriptional regulator, AcrR family [Jiangella alkaliphila]